MRQCARREDGTQRPPSRTYILHVHEVEPPVRAATADATQVDNLGTMCIAPPSVSCRDAMRRAQSRYRRHRHGNEQRQCRVRQASDPHVRKSANRQCVPCHKSPSPGYEFARPDLCCNGMRALICLTYGFSVHGSRFSGNTPVAQAAGSRVDPLWNYVAGIRRCREDSVR